MANEKISVDLIVKAIAEGFDKLVESQELVAESGDKIADVEENLGDSTDELNKKLEEAYAQGLSFNEALEQVSGTSSGTATDIGELNEIMEADTEILKQASDAGLSFEDTLKLIRGQAELVNGKLEPIGKTVEETGHHMEKAGKKTDNFKKQLLQLGKGLIGIASLYTLGYKLADAIGEWVTNMREAWIAEAKLTDKTGELTKKEEELAAVQQKLNALQGERLFGDYEKNLQFQIQFHKQAIVQQELTRKKQAELNLEYRRSGEVVDLVTGKVISYDEALQRLGIDLGQAEEGHKELGARVYKEGVFYDKSGAAIGGWEQRQRAAARAARESKQAIEEETGAVEDLTKAFDLSQIDLGIADTLADFLDKIAFQSVGGGELQYITDAINQAWMDGKITDQQAKEWFEAAFIEAEALQVQLGNITADEAAENITNKLGGSLEDARAKVDAILSGLDLISVIDIRIETEAGGDRTLFEAYGGRERVDEELKTPLITAFREATTEATSVLGEIPLSAKVAIDDALPEIKRLDSEGFGEWLKRVHEVDDKIGEMFSRADLTITFSSSGGGDTLP